MKFFTFVKGNALTFLCLKEKLQKKQTSLLLDLLASMEAVSRKARWSLRERLRERRTVRLPKTRRFSDATRFFVDI